MKKNHWTIDDLKPDEIERINEKACSIIEEKLTKEMLSEWESLRPLAEKWASELSKELTRITLEYFDWFDGYND